MNVYSFVSRWNRLELLIAINNSKRFQTNKRSSYLSYTTMNNKHIFNDIDHDCCQNIARESMRDLGVYLVLIV